MMQTYVALDLETTGLQPKTDRILEIGALKVVNDEIVDTYRTFVNPRMKIPDSIRQLTGITQEMVEGQPYQEEAVSNILDFCGDLPLLGHNILFDYSFLKHQAANLRREFEKKACDTLHIARKAFPGLPSRSLTSMCSYYAIDRTRAHRAYDDAWASMKLYEYLWGEFGKKNPAWFETKPLTYKVKRQNPITPAQKRYLNDLIKYHKIEAEVEPDSLTKNEASRMIDHIILRYGRIER
ncbi:3'-5' exonuclease [Novisyntrophococcus fermenticellae]|uniref:3'-5' exonuclease n=1 Tax=Novisyntrophococcus fermenticellae TaxID=2068655 RepID=UPI001E3EACC3|nr:3'-5' exonuclease [Novisyntrophococcus fermenticellae]